MRHVALLRGINVGGRNKLPMKELVALFEAAGAIDVQSYIQSGNVIYDAPASLARRLPGAITTSIEQRFGHDVPVVTRTASELARIVEANPFEVDPTTLHVAFLAGKPSTTALDPERSPGDRFVLNGREIYMHLPNGVARTKLTNAWFDRQLATISTARNWKTTLKLLELAGAST